MTVAGLGASQRQGAMRRWEVLRPALEEQIPLARTAREAGVPLRTAQRWLARYQRDGLVGLARRARADRGSRRSEPEIVRFIEGQALCRPSPSIATIARRARALAEANGWRVPSYSTVYDVVTSLDPALVTLALDGPVAYRDRYELVFRREAAGPNAVWQADHTELDVLVVDANGEPVRPWLTVVLDDFSRAIAGYTVFHGAPSALNTSLALRQAIWRKTDPRWMVCGVPETLYVDHGSDFASVHLAQVAADLRIELVYSTVARPQGRGKVERFFGSLTSELLPDLPGHLVRGKPANAPRLTLAQLDTAIGEHILTSYHPRPHSETRRPPQQSWLGDGWLPRMPDSLEDLDLLLVMVAKARVVHRDGIRFQGLRYLAPTLAAYVGEPVTIRYDPRDMAEVRVFHRDQFLCRAVSPDHAGEMITLKDIQAARRARRRKLRSQINERVTAAAHPTASPTPVQRTPPRRKPRLHAYLEDRE